MKVTQLSDKIGLIDSDLIEEAANAGASAKRKFNAKRTGIAVLAAVLLVAALFTTALAVSDDFRAAVISFFKLSTAETVVQSSGATTGTDISIVSTANVDGLVNVNYLQMDQEYDYNDGVIFSYNETDGYGNGTYHRIENNTLVPLETKRVETSFECRGYTWNVRFDYAVIDGKLYIHNMPDSLMPEVGDTYVLYAYAAAMKDGSTQDVLLTLPFPHANLRSYSEYAVTMDISTNKVTDFLSGCGFDKLDYLANKISFSDDLSKAVVTCYSKDYNGFACYYYCDINSQKLVPMRHVTGADVSECWFLDNETLFYYTADSSDGWRINLATGEKTSVYSGLKLYTDADGGVQFLGGKYALLIGADRKAWLMDLSKGTQTFIDGFTFTKFNGAYLNTDQTKIYFMRYNDDLEIGNLGVLNIPAAKLIMMDREGQGIRREWNLGWFDNNRIVVNAYGKDNDNYLYLYAFKN